MNNGLTVSAAITTLVPAVSTLVASTISALVTAAIPTLIASTVSTLFSLPVLILTGFAIALSACLARTSAIIFVFFILIFFLFSLTAGPGTLGSGFAGL